MSAAENRGLPARIAVLVAVVLALIWHDATAQPAPREPLNVMTFNIRYGTAKDGDNHWSARREMLFDLLRERDADLVGLQEALAFQIDEILAALPGYAALGVGRDDAGQEWESSRRFSSRRDASASPMPARSGSRTRPRCPRRNRGATTSRGSAPGRASSIATAAASITSTCTSITSRSRRASAARRSSASASTRARSPAIRSIVTGDFNVGERNPALSTLVSKEPTASPFVDTYRVLHADETVVGTFTGFKMGNTNGEKIDYVLVQPGAEVITAEIIRTSRNDRYPSDHFPVSAVIRLAAK